MTAGLFNQCIAKWFHSIPAWLTTETKVEHFYILFKCRRQVQSWPEGRRVEGSTFPEAFWRWRDTDGSTRMSGLAGAVSYTLFLLFHVTSWTKALSPWGSMKYSDSDDSATKKWIVAAKNKMCESHHPLESSCISFLRTVVIPGFGFGLFLLSL